MAYVYRHIRLDKNEPFYIGIGSDNNYKRAYSRFKRSKFWNNIASKTEYSVDILIDNLTWEEACEKEREFIALYGRVNLNTGTLVNLTNGGEGMNGIVLTEETIMKFSISRMGNKNAASRLVLNTLNGIYYDSVKEAAISIGASVHPLYKKLSGRLKNNTRFIAA
jgi:hypothetical protein